VVDFRGGKKNLGDERHDYPSTLSTSKPIDTKLYTRIEGTGEGVWRIRERNTAPEDVYVWICIRGKGFEQMEGTRIFLSAPV